MSQYSLIEVSYRANTHLLPDIHTLRHSVFSDRLNWEVNNSGGMEIDHYDMYVPIHLAVIDCNDEVVACARLISTLKPYMLKGTFPALLGNHKAPEVASVYEVSRFAVNKSAAKSKCNNGLRHVTSLLIQGIAEWSIEKKLEKLVAVVDIRMEKILSRSGWKLDRYSDPSQVGVTSALAGELPIYCGLLDCLRAKSGITHLAWSDRSIQLASIAS